MVNKILLWTNIKSMAKLEILTRASYLLLITIPLLAALWPGVKVIINQYNDSINKTVSILEYSTARLEFESKKLDRHLSNNNLSQDIQVIIKNLEVNIKTIKDNIANASIKNDFLPTTWALLFFASISIFIAHLIYQSSVPTLINEKEIDDFVLFKKEEYSKHPSERTLDFCTQCANILKFPLPKERLLTSTGDKREKELMKRNVQIVDIGFKAHYLLRNQHKPIAIGISGGLYITGMLMILYVILEQSIAVSKATGWLT